LYGGRVSLLVAFVAISSGTIVGTTLGVLAGYMGGAVDEIIMRFVDMWIALPFILLALVIAIVLGQSFGVMFLLLALIAWVGFVRPIRGEVLSLREKEYVQYARSSGASHLRVMVRHILPNVASTVLVLATMGAGGMVLAESVLSFLGVGIPQPTPTWGGMISDGRSYLEDAYWISSAPGIAILLLVVSLNFLGDWLRDHWDPKLNQLI
jgi:peptide/nickel transport system permease protein